MRLSEEYRTVIKETLHKNFGEGSKFYLFGSRVDDNRRGGDIDLYVESSLDREQSSNASLKTKIDLMKSLGEQKIDIVVHVGGSKRLPIHEIARMTGVVI